MEPQNLRGAKLALSDMEGVYYKMLFYPISMLFIEIFVLVLQLPTILCLFMSTIVLVVGLLMCCICYAISIRVRKWQKLIDTMENSNE